MKWVSATLSKPGGKDANGDATGHVEAEAGLGCWVVADGQGSRGVGKTAARKAVAAIEHAFAAHPAVSNEILLESLEAAQKEILDLQAEIVRNQSMRVAAAVFCASRRAALWAHVGNVRVYAFRNGELLSRTEDHSITQMLLNAGEITPAQARDHGDKHRLLRSLGTPGTLQPTLAESRLMLLPGDLFLLCTDGFWEYVNELEMQADWCKSASLAKWLEHMEMRLLKAVPADHDNYSAIALMAEAEA